ncbi:unnamed protein product [Symbiodinium microadriaticum]|nr:unnamed protein product [Symbiodinium microadriaticum]
MLDALFRQEMVAVNLQRIMDWISGTTYVLEHRGFGPPPLEVVNGFVFQLDRLGMQELGAHFESMTANALAYHTHLVEALSSEDVICRPIYVSWYRQLLHDLQAGRALSMSAPANLPLEVPSMHACEFCDQTFDDIRTLRIHQRKSHREDLPEDWLILLFLWMGDEPGIAPPTRAETNYFLSLFPRPSQMQKDQAEPMDTKDQPKRGTFEDTFTREESLSKAMRGETHNEATSHKELPAKVPMMSSPTPPSTTASPANTMTPQHQQHQNATSTTPSGKGKPKKGKQNKGQGKGPKGNSDPSQIRLVAEDEEGMQEHPLRIVMLSTLLDVMIERAQAAVEPTRLEASAQAGLILNHGDEPFWPFLRWNPARRVEEIVSSEEARPLEHSRLMRKLNQIRDTINPENILRCHGYHSISENMTGDTWRLLLEIETVGEEAQNLHAWLRRMINCTAWKLIGGRFRRERLGRSPLANRLAELLG